MNVKKKIAMSAGGAVLVACVTLGGLASANAATTTTASSAAVKAAAAKTATVSSASAAKAATVSSAGTTTTSVPVPQSPGGAVQFPDWVKTLTTAQKQALLADLQARLTNYQVLVKNGVVRMDHAVFDKLTYSAGVVKASLGK
jgi:hypothetical protein